MVQKLRLMSVLALTVFVDVAPLLVLQAVLDFVNDGASWSTAADAVMLLPAFALIVLVFAACRTAALAHRARGTGIPVTADALNTTQTHTFHGVPFDRIRADLSGGERAVAVVGAADGSRLQLRWLPFPSRKSVAVSVTFDEFSEEARVRVSAGESPLRTTLLRRGAAFVALCQIVRSVTAADEPAGTVT